MKATAIKSNNWNKTNGEYTETKNNLNNKISSLKQNVATLIQEVKELGNLSYLDLTHGINLYEEMQKFEVKLIQQALEETSGRQVQAAQLLGLKVTTLNAKIKRYNIDPRELVKD
jgi:transcriptional regulator with GAF, ATPase, and Fis domain